MTDCMSEQDCDELRPLLQEVLVDVGVVRRVLVHRSAACYDPGLEIIITDCHKARKLLSELRLLADKVESEGNGG